MKLTASPKKLRDGTWGALVDGEATEGDIITITTRSGKSWDARVRRVIWTGEKRYNVEHADDQVSICETESIRDTEDPRIERASRQHAIRPCSRCGTWCEGDCQSDDLAYNPGHADDGNNY